MEILSHRAPDVVGTLVEHVRRGRLVCLMADRNFSGRGVEVDFAGRRVTMPVGPALVARRSGAALVPAVAHYGGEPLRRGVPHAPGSSARSCPRGPATTAWWRWSRGARTSSPQVLQSHPEDWHLLQPFFDVPARTPAPA